MKFFRILRKNISLRIVNFIGLTILFTCLLLSASYIKQELSYDKHHANADRIVRLSLQYDNKPVDVRIWGNSELELLQQIPEIERVVKMIKTETAVLHYQGKKMVIKNFYEVNNEFLQVFDIPLLQGDKENALNHRGQALVSEKLAQQLFGNLENVEFQTSKLFIEGRHYTDTLTVSGIFKEMPQTSHFNTDMLVYLPDNYANQSHLYSYLLLKKNTDIETVTQKFTELMTGNEVEVRALWMPLTDIHLHSHYQREMSVNGNIHYIYLILGANVLLLIVVLFNLWLNASLIFAHNRRYYQLLRLHGSTSSVVFKNETLLALFLGVLSIITGILSAYYLSSSGYFSLLLTSFEISLLGLCFLCFIVLVSLIPAMKDISLTQFISTHIDLKPVRFSYSSVKYMLIAQYAVVMIVVILAFGINKQMNLVKNSQVGGNAQTILVTTEQPGQVQEKFKVLKTELLKHKEIKAVTASFQLPGDAIRDHANIKKEEDEEGQWIKIMAVDEDFIPFFNIPLIAGKTFSQGKFDYQTELNMMYDFWGYGKSSDYIEEYVINQKALTMLGFETPEDAIGKALTLQHGGIGYFDKGTIVGVTNDFNYTGLYEEIEPLLILQRNMFLHYIMVRFDPEHFQQARTVFENVWNEIYPDYPADYMFMNDVFGKMYRNEMNANVLVFIFSVLCFAVADLGLIIVMAFIIKRRMKEIGLRKVHGASIGEIIRMLNIGFIRYIAVAFIIAIPVAWYIMHRWLERFAYKTSLTWWIFGLAGFAVLLVSVLSVSLQTWRAASANPVEAIKIE